MLSEFKFFKTFLSIFALTFSAAGITAYASVIPIERSGFSSSASLIDFTGVADGREVNGLVVNGVTFAYTIAGKATNGALIVDGGPGPTNNLDPLNIVSVGKNTGILSLTLPSPAHRFGYGFAVLSLGTSLNATTISLYDMSQLVGSLSYPGVGDPFFTGGFAGIQSTTPFTSVALTFDTLSPAFAIDNITYEAALPDAEIPEPATSVLMLGGTALAFFLRRSKYSALLR